MVGLFCAAQRGREISRLSKLAETGRRPLHPRFDLLGDELCCLVVDKVAGAWQRHQGGNVVHLAKRAVESAGWNIRIDGAEQDQGWRLDERQLSDIENLPSGMLAL